MTISHIQTLAVATTTISPVCPKCGTIHKSGKISCCGRGGSWFKNCGTAGNTQLEHTWQEGIRACKARTQSKTAMGQQQLYDESGKSPILTSIDASTFMTSSVHTPANMSITTPAHARMDHSLTNMLITAQSHAPASKFKVVKIHWTSLLITSVFCLL